MEQKTDKLSRGEARVANRHTKQLATIGLLPTVKSPKRGNVIFGVLTNDSIRARGKVEPEVFFPDFCKHLAKQGYSTHFVFNKEDLLKKSKLKNSCIVHIYNEDRKIPDDHDVEEAEKNASIVLNKLSTGRIIGNKIKTNTYLSKQGILMPSMDGAKDDMMFSNQVNNTSRETWLEKGDKVDKKRYNTKYIDTRWDYKGNDYYTTVRLLTIGREIVHAFIGARPASQKQPSVHGVDTPRNARLVKHFYKTLYEDRKLELQILANKLDDALGPGFYHHDLMIERGTGNIYICEVGIKFDAYAYGTHLKSVRKKVPCLEPFYTEQYAQMSADALLRRWKSESLNS